jgi:CRISPR-associated endonuclease/helicase Cas3
VILFSKPKKNAAAEPHLFADEDDLASLAEREISLAKHTAAVMRAAGKLAPACLSQADAEPHLSAARWHDAGKLDPRFQLLLHHGDELAAASAFEPLAKSPHLVLSPERRRAIALPDSFRHEMLSLQLVEHLDLLPENEELRDLALHLIASHHGYARPFAPICEEAAPSPVDGTLHETSLAIEAAVRRGWVPPHRIDSGIAERFWRLTRRYGWWGLAMHEAVFRLADWYASARPEIAEAESPTP